MKCIDEINSHIRLIGFQKFESFKKEMALDSISQYVLETIERETLKRELIGFLIGLFITILGYAENSKYEIMSKMYGQRLFLSLLLILIYCVYFSSSFFNMKTYKEAELCAKRELQNNFGEEEKSKPIIIMAIKNIVTPRMELYDQDILRFCDLLTGYMISSIGINKNSSVAVYELMDEELWMPGYRSNQARCADPKLFKKKKSAANKTNYANYYFYRCMNDHSKKLFVLKNKESIDNKFYVPKQNYSQYGNYKIELGNGHIVLIELISYENDKLITDENELEKYVESFVKIYEETIAMIFDMHKD